MVIFWGSFHNPHFGPNFKAPGLMGSAIGKIRCWHQISWWGDTKWYRRRDLINEFWMAWGSWWWSYGVCDRVGSEEGFGVWGLSGVGWGQEGALFAHFFCLFSPAFMFRATWQGGGVMVTFVWPRSFCQNQNIDKSRPSVIHLKY